MRKYEEYRNQAPEEREMVLQAARDGHRGLFHLYIELGKDPVQYRDSRGYSPLMLAAYHGHAGLVRLLLGAGADPNDADTGGSTVLMGAAFKGHLDVVEALLAAGADPSRRNSRGQNALLFARMFGRNDVARRLEPRFRDGLCSQAGAWARYIQLIVMKGR